MSEKNQPCQQNSNTTQPPREISHLQRREIQAPIAACLIRAYARAMGHDEAIDVATAAIQSDALLAGRKMAEHYGENSMAALGRVVREVWAQDEAITIRFVEQTERTLNFDVTRCRYAEFYEKAGMKELGFCLSCCRDGSFAKGFNPRILLSRSQTIMEGAATCDFRFALRDSK